MIFWSNVLIPVTSMIITVFATLYTVTERVKNENKEKHKPYLALNDIDKLDSIDEYKYYLTVLGKNYKEEHQNWSIDEVNKTEEKDYIMVRFLLDNIGYGVASNIKFYDLLTGEQIKGTQTPSKDKIQKLVTTFDIASNKQKQVQAKILNKIGKEEPQDHCKILCIYQDLNGNTYDFILRLNIKSNDSYDFSTYQRTSHSYAKCISQYKKNYGRIIKEYKK